MGSRDDMTDYRERICNRTGQACAWPQDRPTHECPDAHDGRDYDRDRETLKDLEGERGTE
jgi:hypothetical protein